MKSCLMVIDVQNGFISDHTRHVIAPIATLLAQNHFDHTLFTRFQNKPNSPYQVILNWHRLNGPGEQALVDEIKPYAKCVLDKPIYSAVNDDVMQFLQSEQIQEVHLLGIDTDCCVLKTAVDLFERGIRPIVLADYCASNGGVVSHDAGIRVLERLIGRGNIVRGEVVGK
jgi:nicotinamidase-related amidase